MLSMSKKWIFEPRSIIPAGKRKQPEALFLHFPLFLWVRLEWPKRPGGLGCAGGVEIDPADTASPACAATRSSAHRALQLTRLGGLAASTAFLKTPTCDEEEPLLVAAILGQGSSSCAWAWEGSTRSHRLVACPSSTSGYACSTFLKYFPNPYQFHATRAPCALAWWDRGW